MNKSESFTLRFVDLDKDWHNFQSRFMNRIAKVSSSHMFAFLCSVYHEAATVPYVQAAILNLPYP